MRRPLQVKLDGKGLEEILGVSESRAQKLAERIYKKLPDEYGVEEIVKAIRQVTRSAEERVAMAFLWGKILARMMMEDPWKAVTDRTFFLATILMLDGFMETARKQHGRANLAAVLKVAYEEGADLNRALTNVLIVGISLAYLEVVQGAVMDDGESV